MRVKYFIKTGKFDVGCSKIIETAFRIRNNSDYDDFYVVTKEEAEQQLLNAAGFIKLVEEYLLELWGQLENDK